MLPLAFVVLAISILFSLFEAACFTNLNCEDCVEDNSCGWCGVSNVCLQGNETGPNGANCEDWQYGMCNTSPPNLMGWYHFGGNAQHTGYVGYNHKITENTNIKQTFLQSYAGQTLGLSLITSHANIIYYWVAADVVGKNSTFYAQNIATSAILWSTTLKSEIQYCSQPSLTLDLQSLISVCYSTYSSTKYLEIRILNANNGNIQSETLSYQQRISTYYSLYSPIIADNLATFMIQWYYSGYNIGEYYYNTFSKLWESLSIPTYSLGQQLSSYNPITKTFYTHASTTSNYYGTLIVSQWMNGWNIANAYSSQRISTPKDTMVLSLKHNITFISGTTLCAFNWSDDQYPPLLNPIWCSSTSTSQTLDYNIPSIDESNDILYVWSQIKGSIISMNIVTGEVINSYGSNLVSNCDWKYGVSVTDCPGHQPLITPFNIFWTDGQDIFIFDIQSKFIVNRVNNVCGATSTKGVYLSWSNDQLIVVCMDSISAYSFQ